MDFIVVSLSNCVLEMNFFQNLLLFLPLKIDAILEYFTMTIIQLKKFALHYTMYIILMNTTIIP